MKKKVLTGMLSMAVMAAMALPVYAEDSGSTTVDYKQASTWTVSIPKTTVNANAGEEKAVDLNVTAINIEPGKKLQVKIGKNGTSDISNGVVTLKRDDDEAVTTTVSTGNNKSNPVSTGTVIAEFQNQDKKPTSGGKLYFSAINESNAKAGEYSGTMTYTMATEYPPLS